ncbi:MAG: ADP-ribosylglycohydrolase family protein [Rhodospirillales bacterium]|nr:ADP-ribosylglycohydrolase family protein [Rhodospirillales bacterium]
MTPPPDRFTGSLVGQCLGDALGFLVEGEPPEICAGYVRDVVLPCRLPGRTRNAFRFGQYSDDSQMARELMQSFLASGGFDPADYARRIADLFAENRVVGCGRSTAEAAARLAAGVPWDRAGTPPPSAGNGSAMRAGPVGLFFAGAPDLVRVADAQGRITHADRRCSAGAVAIAGAVALAARCKRIERESFLDTLDQWVMGVDATMASALRQLADCLELPEAEAADRIARAGLPPGVDGHWHGGISGFVVGSVLWALYAFLRNTEDYVGAIATAIWPGGDVDTTAAMAGAIAGAHLGLAAIPADLAGHLNDRGTWAYRELVELAEACHALAERSPGR